jgi:thiol-disulfide isomerase/thioredoxin
MKRQFLEEEFSKALEYAAYLETGTEQQRQRWKQVYDAARLTGAQESLLRGFVRQMNLLIVSGIWCGDCVQQCPLIARIAEANPEKIRLRLVDRDVHAELSREVQINGGGRVPVVLFLAEDFEFCGLAGDRSLNRYRAMAKKYLGAACPTGIVAPDQDELTATLCDWVGEVERVQLMLRLSPRLRDRYAD